MTKDQILNQIKGRIIVSVQAEKTEPMGKPEILAALAQTVVIGGAAGIRACYAENIRAIKNAVDVPVIGISKDVYPDSDVFITPTWKENKEILDTNPDILALDATLRKRPRGEKLEDIVRKIRDYSDILIMADCATFDDAIHAAKLGFDFIGTTLSGYTKETEDRAIPYTPDFELIKQIVEAFGRDIPIIAEGRIWTPEQAKKIYGLGVFSIVIGSVITRPHHITRRFVEAIQ
ncbi:MAG: N-acetylmannosamine-6-phosphate 2-epimerase [Candidatus Marinimicrobia bacterium]|nr:N-acetylmannosamine-6-phosphate 2-epimerase [Candidatus Neomarinimicrobiota bacterium]